MNRELLDMLSRISEEERSILNGENVIKKSDYTSAREFVIDSRRMMERGELIAMRTHTRFVCFPEHRHNYIEMMYVCQGNITHSINGSKVVMEEGDILMLGRHTRHALAAAGAGDIGVNLVILPEFFDKALEMLEGNNILADFLVGLLKQTGDEGQYLHFATKSDLRVSNLMENLIYSLVYKQDNANVINKTTMGLLFMCLVQNIQMLKRDAPNNYQDIMIRSVHSYIDEHYKTARLSELAENLHLSMPSTSKFVKKITGNTFIEMLQQKRFDVALRLMRDTELSISDIVAAVGYENNSYFHRRFREQFKMSPMEYRKAYGNR